VRETAKGSEALPGLRERKKQEIHDRIVDAARTLFNEKGFEATTVDEICARVDVSQKTFFNYFPTKQHVVHKIAAVFLNDLGALVEEARKVRGTTAKRLAHLFRRAGEGALAAGPRHKELLIEVVRLVQVDGSGPEQTRWLHSVFLALIEDGVAAGELTTEHDAGFLTEMVVGAFIWILLNWQSVEGYPVQEHLDEAARFLGRVISRDDRAAPKKKNKKK
jgi:AcrR family transcriptional regulator